ncbi:MAG: T9SS type A sorting domain-containing protein, partial [Bacteroidales bacterium]
GNSNERRDYDFDYSESNAIEYIRLRQVDYDGAYEFHGPVYVTDNNEAISQQPDIYPNPVESDFYVSFPEPLTSEARVRLFNSMGQCVKDFTMQPGNQNTQINISKDMPAGMYFLKIDGSLNTAQKIHIH